jgi:WD40 repeat protein
MELDDIVCEEHVFSVQFHPTEPVIATAIITGHVELYTLDYSSHKNTRVLNSQVHEESCRCVRFLPGGNGLVSCSKDGGISVLDRSGRQAWATTVENSVNTIYAFDETSIAAGDDEGSVHLIDLRQQKVVKVLSEQEDFVADMACHGSHLLCAGGDGTLCVYDMRSRTLEALSDPQDDERLSVVVAKDGKKVGVGTQSGVVEIFSFGSYGDLNDRLPGHPSSVDTLVKYDEDTLISGSSDGVVRVVSLFPNRILGALGEHVEAAGEAFPIEEVALSPDRKLVASCSHDLHVKFWSTDNVPDLQGKRESKEKTKGDPSVKQQMAAQFFADM